MDLVAAVLGIVAVLVVLSTFLQLALIIEWRLGSRSERPLLRPAALCQMLIAVRTGGWSLPVHSRRTALSNELGSGGQTPRL